MYKYFFFRIVSVFRMVLGGSAFQEGLFSPLRTLAAVEDSESRVVAEKTHLSRVNRQNNLSGRACSQSVEETQPDTHTHSLLPNFSPFPPCKRYIEYLHLKKIRALATKHVPLPEAFGW